MHNPQQQAASIFHSGYPANDTVAIQPDANWRSSTAVIAQTL
jgi:hypothetical protein